MWAKTRAIFATLSIALYLPIIIAQIYFTRKHNNGRWARKQCRWFFGLNGLSVERVGEYDKDAQLLVMNHQSVTDIIYFDAFTRTICVG